MKLKALQRKRTALRARSRAGGFANRRMLVESLEDRRLLAGLISTSQLQANELERAFERVSDLDQYSASQLATAQEWVINLSAAANPNEVANDLGVPLRANDLIDHTFVVRSSDFGNGDVQAFAQEIINELSDRPEVNYFYPLVEREHARRLLPNDPMFNQQWHLLNTGQTGGTPGADANVELAWDIATGAGVVIGVVDDGIQSNQVPGDHIDLIDKFRADLSYDVNDDDTNPNACGDHGTAVAGVAAATTGNGEGVSGAAPDAQHSALKLICAGTTDAQEAFALSFGAGAIDIYNNSWGPADGFSWLVGPGPLTIAAIQQGTNSGSVYTWAGGNGHQAEDNVNYDGYANNRYTMAVGSVDHNGAQSGYSERGSALLVTAYSNGAPGAGITTTTLNNGYRNDFGGTSSASPLAAGVVALMMEANPNLTYRDINMILAQTAEQTQPNDPEWSTNGAGLTFNHKFGFGSVDALAAVEASVDWDLLPQEVGFTTGRINVSSPIPDGSPQGISNTVNVPEDFIVENVQVVVTAGGGAWGNLDIRLESPSGSVARLAETHAAPTGFSYSGWEFGATNFMGEDAVGDWTITVADTVVGGGQSTFTSYEIIVTGHVVDEGPTDPTDPDPAPPGTISGVKWLDTDGDGLFDEEEEGLGGIYIYADLDGDDRLDIGEPAAITAADGSYTLNVSPGTYIIREVETPGWTLTFPVSGEHEVEVLPDQGVDNVNFGNNGNADYGDAPAPYPTLAADGGATAGILAGFHLGALIDGEADGLVSDNADGDDELGLADEDGVDISDPIFEGITNTITVTVETGSRPAGSFQGWIDLNQDGDWDDPGEQIVKDLVLKTGTHAVSFNIPDGVTIGQTFARFRYGYERGIGPTGAAFAGEIEDYQVLVLADEPLAVDDFYNVDQDTFNNVLSVLDNDFASSTGSITITGVGTPSQGGQVSIGPGGQSLIYSPARNYFSPPVETFTYTISDPEGNTSTATVQVNVLPTLSGPVAVDDTFRVTSTSSNNVFDVLANDLSGLSGPATISFVSQPGGGTAVIDDQGTSDPSDDVILYTPGPTFSDIDAFSYTIQDTNGVLSQARITVHEEPAPDNNDVVISLDVVNSDGESVNTVNVGEEFTLRMTVQDIRPFQPAAGVGAVYTDILFDRSLASVNLDAANPLGFEISFSDDYNNSTNGAVIVPGLIDEVGALQAGLEPLGSGEILVFEVTMTALNNEGTLTFLSDPADVSPDQDVVLFNPPEVVNDSRILYGLRSVEIVDPNRSVSDDQGDGNSSDSGNSDSSSSGNSGNLRSPLDVNGDGSVSPADALSIINHLNDSGSGPVGEGEGGGNAHLDVNRDGMISAIDVLYVINDLNRRAGGEGEGTLLAETSFADLGNLSPVALSSESDSESEEPMSRRAVDLAFSDDPYHGETVASTSAMELAEVGADRGMDDLLGDLAEDVLKCWIDSDLS